MMNLSNLSLNEGVRHRLEASLGRLSHAYIISGPSGSGTQELANHLAAAYVCSSDGDKPCGVCSGCRKAKGNIHPDIIRVGIPEDKRIISVEQARQLRAEAYILPNEASRKVFIIEDAQAMHVSAQNALLKVLEDGPGYLAFLFLTEHPEQLLITIRSRCETLSLIPEHENDVVELGEELKQKANELADLLINGDECSLVECAVVLERQKMDKGTVQAFLDALEGALRPELGKNPSKLVPLMEHLKQIQKAAQFNVGTGHLFGWLTAKI